MAQAAITEGGENALQHNCSVHCMRSSPKLSMHAQQHQWQAMWLAVPSAGSNACSQAHSCDCVSLRMCPHMLPQGTLDRRHRGLRTPLAGGFFGKTYIQSLPHNANTANCLLSPALLILLWWALSCRLLMLSCLRRMAANASGVWTTQHAGPSGRSLASARTGVLRRLLAPISTESAIACLVLPSVSHALKTWQVPACYDRVLLCRWRAAWGVT
jgi:hypothetical protein